MANSAGGQGRPDRVAILANFAYINFSPDQDWYHQRSHHKNPGLPGDKPSSYHMTAPPRYCRLRHAIQAAGWLWSLPPLRPLNATMKSPSAANCFRQRAARAESAPGLLSTKT